MLFQCFFFFFKLLFLLFFLFLTVRLWADKLSEHSKWAHTCSHMVSFLPHLCCTHFQSLLLDALILCISLWMIFISLFSINTGLQEYDGNNLYVIQLIT